MVLTTVRPNLFLLFVYQQQAHTVLDVNDLVRKCGFAYTTYNTALPPPISTTAPGYGPPATPLVPATTSVVSAPAPPPAQQSSGTAPAAPAPPATTGGYGNGTTTTGAPAPPPLNEPTGTSSGAPAEQTTNAAAVNVVGAGMLGVGVLGWVFGVM
jgi:hypothetical protein